jgi:hypothetical protein
MMTAIEQLRDTAERATTSRKGTDMRVEEYRAVLRWFAEEVERRTFYGISRLTYTDYQLDQRRVGIAADILLELGIPNTLRPCCDKCKKRTYGASVGGLCVPCADDERNK